MSPLEDRFPETSWMRLLFLLHHSVSHERMGVMQLSAIARARGHETLLRHASAFRSTARLVEFARSWRPDVLLYSMMSGEAEPLFEVNRRLRVEVDALSIAGGPHPTFRPECLEEESALDAICVGEGDGALADLCDLYPAGPWREIPNLHVRARAGRIRRNPPRDLVEDLDRLPPPDREIMIEENPRLRDEDTRLFFAARGCPYECSYCFNPSRNRLFQGKGRTVRFRSVPNLVSEIREVGRRHPMRYVCLFDDMFLAKPREWLDDFCRAMEPLGYRIICNVRPDAVTDETIGPLRRAGLFTVWMGIECGDEGVAREVLHRNVGNARILEAAATLARHGVRIVTTNLILLPVADPLDVDRKTVELNRRIRPVFAWSSIVYPYPGTEIERYSREHGFLAEPDGRAVRAARAAETVLRYHPSVDRERCARLQPLFGLFVESSAAWRLSELLLKLPLRPLYLGVFYLWYGYCSYFRIRPGGGLRRRLPAVGAFLLRFARGR